MKNLINSMNSELYMDGVAVLRGPLFKLDNVFGDLCLPRKTF